MATLFRDELEDLRNRLDVATQWLINNEARLRDSGWLNSGELMELWDCLNSAVELLDEVLSRD